MGARRGRVLEEKVGKRARSFLFPGTKRAGKKKGIVLGK